MILWAVFAKIYRLGWCQICLSQEIDLILWDTEWGRRRRQEHPAANFNGRGVGQQMKSNNREGMKSIIHLVVVVGLVFQQQESVKSELIEKSFIGGYSSSSYFSSGVQFCFGDHYWCSGKCWGITTNMTVMLRMIIMINIIFCCVVDSGECIACGKG